jgi:hypothetical protein
MIAHNTIHQHVITPTNGRPPIRVWNQENGNLKISQATSWLALDDAELEAVLDAIAELRPNILDNEPALGSLYKSGTK